jgi:hypothetical protein
VFDLRDAPAPELPLEVPHFELDEDPAFWKDRNVQVWVSALDPLPSVMFSTSSNTKSA